MRAAAIQLNATDDVERNLETADRLVRQAAGRGAELVVLPETWTVMGAREQMIAGAQTLDGQAISWARAIAAELGIDLMAGSFSERRDGAELLSNTSVHVDPQGEIAGDLPQDPPVRRRDRRRRLRRGQHLRARTSDRHDDARVAGRRPD